MRLAVVMVSLPRSAVLAVEPAAAAMVLREVSLWSQTERILDVAVIEGNPARMLVLDANGVTSYRLQDSRWQSEQALPDRPLAAVAARSAGKAGSCAATKTIFSMPTCPAFYCRGSAASSLAMTCYDSDDSWPIGADSVQPECVFYFLAAISSAAHSLPEQASKRRRRRFIPPPLFLANKSRAWLLAAVDGTGPSARRQHRSGGGKAGVGQ